MPEATGYRARRVGGPVLVGVKPGQSLAVVHRAADLALSLAVPLVCAFVDPTAVEEREADGRVEALPIDPDGVDDDAAGVRADLYRSLYGELAGSGLNWRFVALSGEPATALGAHANDVEASIIVVGTHERTRLEEIIGGSVAVHLSHRQPRPVLVVPLSHHRGRVREEGS